MPVKVKIIIFLLINIVFMGRVFSQYSAHLQSVESLINSGGYDDALNKLRTMDSVGLSPKNKACYFFLLAKCLDSKNQHDEAYANYLIAKKHYLSIDSITKAMYINLDIAYILGSQRKPKNNYAKYLDESLKYASKNGDSLLLASTYASIARHNLGRKDYTQSLAYFKKALDINSRKKNKQLEISIHDNLAVLYNEDLNKPDSALYYLRKDVDYLKSNNRKRDLCYNYVNQAGAYYYLGDSKKAIQYLKMADSLAVGEYSKGIRQSIYWILAINYSELNDYRNAYDYLSLSQAYRDTIGEEQQAIAINDIQVKYETKEKELENKVLKGNIKTNRILLYTFLGLLIASLVIGYLIVKNSQRKIKISRQEKLIEQQKLEKALKEYELSSIDLMLEGQEKERQRIADDLHDNLGSMLATLKLNFENLKLRKNELANDENKLYERTDELIEEAYQKVRRLAHSKNAGVFANEGLIPALKKMAAKISIPGKLSIQVIAFGFENRLENTLEIAIFRMAQELSTNIIKHSKATEATLHLTHHEDNINMMIEDNGIGFNSETIDTANGMGLQNIKKKTQQLGGTFTVDSTPGRGTTIIIDLPI